MRSEFSRGKGGAEAGPQCVMDPLRSGTGVTLRDRGRRLAVDSRRLIGRVAHTGSGQLAQHRIEIGTGLRVQQSGDRRHAVVALPSDGQPSASSPIRIGEFPVRVDQGGDPISALTEMFGPEPDGHGCQFLFRRLPGADVDIRWQGLEEPADDPHVFFSDTAAAQSCGSVREVGRQRLPGKGPAGA